MNETHPIANNTRISLDGLMYKGELVTNHVKAGNYGTIVRPRASKGANIYHVMISDGSGMLEIEVPAAQPKL